MTAGKFHLMPKLGKQTRGDNMYQNRYQFARDCLRGLKNDAFFLETLEYGKSTTAFVY